VALKVAGHSAIWQSTYEFLLALYSNYAPVLHCFWDIIRYWSEIANFNVPHLYLAPPLKGTHLNFTRIFCMRKLRVYGLLYGIVCLILCWVVLVQDVSVYLSQADDSIAPQYLSELLQPVADLESRQRLRSSSTSQLVVPCMRRSTIGDRAFTVAAPRSWNSLPDSLHRLSSLEQFKKLLKTHLFKISFAQQDSLWL